MPLLFKNLRMVVMSSGNSVSRFITGPKILFTFIFLKPLYSLFPFRSLSFNNNLTALFPNGPYFSPVLLIKLSIWLDEFLS